MIVIIYNLLQMSNWRIITILLIVIALLGVTIVTMGQVSRADVTRVVFLNVGQGDGILITRGARQILIDGGANDKVLMEQLSRYMPFWDRTIDVMISTHPDSDHIGAQIGVFGAYHVPVVIATNAFKKSSTATAWHSALARERSEVIVANAATVVKLAQNNDEAGILRVVFPRTEELDVSGKEDANDTSVVARLDVGETSFLFTGDMSSSKESLIAQNDADVDILKVGHHGSRFSTAEFFLDAVTPSQAVISVGRDNRYGHPTQEVLRKLQNRNIDILRTDQDGVIVYICRDGKCKLAR